MKVPVLGSILLHSYNPLAIDNNISSEDPNPDPTRYAEPGATEIVDAHEVFPEIERVLGVTHPGSGDGGSDPDECLERAIGSVREGPGSVVCLNSLAEKHFSGIYPELPGSVGRIQMTTLTLSLARVHEVAMDRGEVVHTTRYLLVDNDNPEHPIESKAISLGDWYVLVDETE